MSSIPSPVTNRILILDCCPSPYISPVAPDSSPGDEFGGSISLYEDTLVVGARYDDDIGTDSGSAHIFVRTGETWNWVSKLLAPEGETEDYFAFSTGMYNGTVAVGSMSGEIHVYSDYK